ncbi:hypothetical protein [Gallaecimonas xiamenensis]|uniref:Uncharacterized protein n=1 Tax=Gallaecimonas xiamenensis 3-C-1 TaxID=745411 RepID=K2KH61_9GAMM|nr:hypothetical protein [Gallaecimonas xiamenensis]EKE76605.1 hypothetical protein B3C1_03390 [Gallaecimonas xiamenensis 3-C-1]
MSEFDKRQAITLDPTHLQSLKAALGQYRQKLDDGSAFRLHMDLLLDIAFCHQDGRPLERGDAGANQALLDKALDSCRQDNKLCHYSEAVLFAAALNFPELYPDLEDTAQALVRFARSRNDSADMAVDDYNLLGVEALYMMAFCRPQWSRYLAAFLVPYWDTQTHYLPLELLNKLVANFGWQRPMISAYLWCDSAQLRRCFYSDSEGNPLQPDLLSHFAKHPDDYPWFKEQLLARLKAQPLLAYSSGNQADDPHPTLDFFYSLGAWPVAADPDDIEEWQDQVKQQPWLGHSVEDEALAILATLQSQAPELPLLEVAPAWQQEDRHQAWKTAKPAPAPKQQEAETAAPNYTRVFSCLSPHSDRLKLAQLEKVDQAIGDDLTSALAALPPHLGSCAYASYRLHNPDCSQEQASLLIDWLQQQLPQALLEAYEDASDDDHEQFEELMAWLVDPANDADPAAMAQLAKDVLYLDGGVKGARISAHQGAYQLLWGEDGLQRGLLSLFWLLGSDRLAKDNGLYLLAKRHWQLWLTLAPQRLINRIFYLRGNYHHYAAIDDIDQERRLCQQLLALGVAQLQLDAFMLLCDQRVARYRPADPRFWRRYQARLAQFAQSTDAERQALQGVLAYCHEDQYLAFLADLACCHPELELPLAPLFEASLERQLADAFPDPVAHKLYRQLLDYLATGQGLEALSPKALGLPRLQGWDPYADQSGKVGPVDFLWLLPKEQGQRLALFLAQLGKRGLHWLGCSWVKEAYVRACIQGGQLTFAERWQHPALGHNPISDPDLGLALLAAKDAWALQWLDSQGVAAQSLVYYAVHEGRNCGPFLQQLAKAQRLPDMKGWLTSAQRAKLATLLGE